jgi:predicted small lipoprotein YifL
MAPVDRKFVTRVLILGLVVAGIGLTGCGRKGALEAPAAAPVVAPDVAPAPPAKNSSFILDPLL